MLAALAVLLLGLVPSTPTVVERNEYYDVAGSSDNELRAAINTRRPKDSDGVQHDAVTNWDVRWTYRSATGAQGCTLTSLSTRLEVVTIMPRWSTRQAGTMLEQRWNAFVAALERHETEHLQISLRAAQRIHERLSSLDAARTCPLLEESINSTGQALLDQFRAEDKEYDRRTQHGASQGARFP